MRKLLYALAAWLAVILVGFIIVNLLQARKEDPTDTYRWLNEYTPEGQAVIAYSLDRIPCLAEFQRVYPQSTLHLWPSFPKRHGTSLTFETLVYGRYMLQLDQEIRTNRKTLSAVALGEPQLSIYEISLLARSSDGSWTETFGLAHSFGPDGWRRLVAANGDLSSILSDVDKEHPLPLAQKYLEMLEEQSTLPK